MRQTRKTMLVTHSRLTHERLKDCYLIHFLIAVLAVWWYWLSTKFYNSRQGPSNL